MLANPFSGDSLGNYFFYANPSSTYHIQIFQNGALLQELPDVSLPGGGGGGSGGTFVKVNSAAVPGVAANFNNLLPAPPASSLNVLWQKDSNGVNTGVSAYVPFATTLAPGVLQLGGDLTGTATSQTVTAVHLSSPLPFAQGGTNAITAAAAFSNLAPATAAGGLIVGTGTNIYGNLPIGLLNQCLVSNGATPIWAACTSGIGPALQNQIPVYNSTNTLTGSALTDASGALTYAGAGFTLGGPTLGSATLGLKGSTSGLVNVTVAAASGNWNFQLPTSGGSNGFCLITDGTGITSWANCGGGGTGSVGNGVPNQFGIYNGLTSIVGSSLLSTNGSNTLLWSGTAISLTNAQAAGVSIGASSDGSSITMGGTSKLTIQGGSRNGAAQDVRILGGPGSSTGFGSSLVFKAGSSTVNAPQTLSPGWVYIYAGTNTNSAGGAIQLAAGYGGATPYPVQIGCNGLFITSCSNGQAAITGTLQLVGKVGNFIGFTVPDNIVAAYTIKLPATTGTNGQALVTDGCPAFVCTLSFTTISGGGGTIAGSGTLNTLTKWTGTSTIGNASATDDGTNFSSTANLGAVITTAATSGSNVSSPFLQLGANFWNGSASTQDLIRLRNVPGAGTNPTQTLVIDHTGSSGAVSVSSGLLFNLTGGLTLGGGVFDAHLATKTVPSITGVGVPSNATCTIAGQLYFRTDAPDPGNPNYHCNGSIWTLQTTSGGGGVWNTIGNPGGNQSLLMQNFTTSWVFGTNTTTPFSITDGSGNLGSGPLVTIATASGSAAAGMLITAQNTTIPLTLQCGSVGCTALSVPSGQGTIKLNSITSNSANAATTGYSRLGGTDAVRYGCPGCNTSFTTTGTTDMNVVSANGTNPVLVGDYLGINVAGTIGTFAAGGSILIRPTTASGAAQGGDTTITSGGSATGPNGNIHIIPATSGLGGPGWIDIGGSGFGVASPSGDSVTPPVQYGPVNYSSTGTVQAAQGATSPAIGICVANCGAGSIPTVVKIGIALCNFDAGAVTIGHYFGISATAGLCADLGTVPSATSASMGFVQSLVTGNQYLVDVVLGAAPSSTVGVVLTQPANNTQNIIIPTSGTVVPLTIQGASGQTASLLHVNKGDGTTALDLSAAGVLTVSNGLGQVQAAQFVSASSNPASSAAANILRLASSDCIAYLSTGGTRDVQVCKNASDAISLINSPGWSVTNFGGNAVSFSVTNPAAPRSITFTDPLGNDSVAYLAALQTLTGKTIGTGGLLFANQAAPGNPAGGNILLYSDSGTGNLACLKSDGSNCLPGGSGGGGFTWDGNLTATGALNVTNGNNATTLTYSTNTPSGAFLVHDTTGNIGVSPLVWFRTEGTSAAIAFRTTAKGSLNGAELTAGGNWRVIGTGELGLNSANALVKEIANDGVTGTTVNLLAKYTTSNTAITTAVTDNGNIEGIVVSGAGTTGNAHIAIAGIAGCKVTNGVAAVGNYIVADVTAVDGGAVAGQCWDAGASAPPAGVQRIGRAMATGAANAVVSVLIQDKSSFTFQGTTNQVNTAFGGGVWTFSLPQSIDSGSTPTWSGVKLVGGTTIQGSTSTSDTGLRCGQNATTSVGCTTTVTAANMTGTGNFIAGSTVITSGNSATTNATKSAGTLTIVPGQATAGAAAGPNNGPILIENAYVKGVTYTVANVQCFSADNTVGDCGTTVTNQLGVAVTSNVNAAMIAVQGSTQVTVNYDASVSPSAGWFACTSATVAGKVTAQSGACAAGRQVGIIEAAGAAVTSGKIQVQFK